MVSDVQRPSPLSGRRLALITSQAFSIGNFRGPLVREWVQRGLQVYAFAPDYDDRTRSTVTELGAEPVDIPLARASLNPFADVRGTCSLAVLLRRYRIEISFSYFIKPVIFGGIAARLAGVPHSFAMIEGAGYVFSEHRNAGFSKTLLKRGVAALYRSGLLKADAAFFLNRDDVALFQSFGAIEQRQVELVGGIGVELDRFTPSEMPMRPFTFLLAARLLEHKGVREFVAAAKRLNAEFPGTRCVVLGSPDLNPASVPESDLQSWHRKGVIEWQPHVDDVRPWMHRASVFVLPSWYREGVPRSIQEAMAIGRPIITTDMPGCRDTIVDEESGLLVQPRDIESLYAAMKRLASEPETARRMGRAARSRAVKYFDARRANGLIVSRMEAALGRSD